MLLTIAAATLATNLMMRLPSSITDVAGIVSKENEGRLWIEFGDSTYRFLFFPAEPHDARSFADGSAAWLKILSEEAEVA